MEQAAQQLTTATPTLAGLEDEDSSSSDSGSDATDDDDDDDDSASLDEAIAEAQQARGGKKKKGKKEKVASQLKVLLKEAKAKKSQRNRRMAAAPPPRPERKKKRPIKVRKADTNVVALALGTLADEETLATGEAVKCSGCEAYFSAISTVRPKTADDATSSSTPAAPSPVDDDDDDDDDIEGIWECEFCSTQNEVYLAKEEVPSSASLDYIVSGPVTAGTARESNVVFCVDTSGSMCVTSEVAGKLKLKGQDRRNKQAEELRAFGDGSNQFLRGQSRNVTYVSRLQCMQAAVETQIEGLSNTEPDVHVGLVSFANDVSLVGDATTGSTVTVAGDHLNEYDYCLSTGSEKTLSAPISQTSKTLVDTLHNMTEEGQTALGPALVAAVGMASERPGSEVIVCTDGKANIGVGAISDNPTEDEEDALTEFYERVGAFARDNGVTVNVITIAGTDCSMENLGTVADASNGHVDIVDPLELATNFSAILAEPPVATSVEIRFLLHEGLKFREDDAVPGSNTLVRTIGNVLPNTDVTLEYSVRREFVRAQPKDAVIELPFQVQITYTRLNGSKCIRVITQRKPITRDRAAAEAEADVAILGLNNVQHSAKYVKSGAYTDVQAYTRSCNKMVSRIASTSVENSRAYVNWARQADSIDTLVHNEQAQEYNAGIFLSDSDDDDDVPISAEQAEMRRRSKMAMKKKARKARRGDASSKVMFQSKHSSASAYVSKSKRRS